MIGNVSVAQARLAPAVARTNYYGCTFALVNGFACSSGAVLATPGNQVIRPNTPTITVAATPTTQAAGAPLQLPTMTRAPDAATRRFTWYGATPEEKAATRASWNGWDVALSLVVLAAVAATTCSMRSLTDTTCA